MTMIDSNTLYGPVSKHLLLAIACMAGFLPVAVVAGEKGMVDFGTFFVLLIPSAVNFLVPASIMHFAVYF